MKPTIVFDFDGTLALGNGPISAFAHAIAERTGDADFPARAAAAVASFESGEAGYRDGYDAVTRVATADGVAADVLGASYDASRALLASDTSSVTPPTDLAAFLERVGARADLVLATNAPGEGVVAVLEAWGVSESFTEMHFAIGKPAGLVPVLRDALTRGPVLAIGDIAEFDLTPATELGADTALVGATVDRSSAPTTMRGRSLADLYDQIAAWTDAALGASPALAPSENPHHTERHN